MTTRPVAAPRSSSRASVPFPQPPCPSAQARHPDAMLEEALSAFPDVNALIDHHAEHRTDHVAIDAPSVADVGTLRLRVTYGELRTQTVALANALAGIGVRANDRIAVIARGEAHAQCILIYLALLRLGATLVPINPRFTPDEVAQALSLARIDGVVAHADFAARLDSLAEANDLKVKIVLDAMAALSPWHRWQTLLTGSSTAAPERPEITPDTLANILFTSGTTGRPKGVMHTHATALATGAIFSRALGLTATDVFHNAIPFFTSSGTQFTLMASLWAGATMITEPAFDAVQILERMRERCTTVYLGVPAHLLFLIDAIERRPGLELPHLRLWDYGGAAMPLDAIARLQARFPGVDQRQNYGLTETGPTGALMAPDDFTTHPGAIGRPMPLCELRITLPDGSNAAIGDVGEICVRSPANMVGYFADADATDKSMDGRWVSTGDLGKLDADGFLYYVDRLKDVVNRGGLKIGSVEVEDAIHRVPEVLEAAVVAVAHPRLGEDLVAFVALRAGCSLDADALRNTLSTSLADYKVPRDIRFVDALPRNPMGKVLKTTLRDIASRPR